jgi:NAD(P)-dependent dehydrogenase (short-subunit alcohol dehydrogenase family)
MKLQGKAALITGAGSGMGRATALLFAREGAKVAVNDVNLESAQKTVEEIKKMGGTAIAIKADISEAKEVEAMIDRVIKEFGGIQILINNAGISVSCPAIETPLELWDRVMGVMLRGTFLCCRKAGQWMVPHREGKVVNISSIAAIRSQVNMSAYATAKAGIVQLTRALALEWGPHNINVNCIIPGGTNTPMLNTHDVPITNEMVKNFIPLGHLGEPEDIANAALFLVSDESHQITGVALPVDGGELCRG